MEARRPVVQYRCFRNTDAPHLVNVWNECFTGRGAVHLRNTTPLEERVFSKPYFDPAGLIVAEANSEVVGYVHAGLGPNAAGTDVISDAGVVCVLGVRPSFRGRGIATELLHRAEAYVLGRGARTIYAGPHWPLDPFYFGLYGGSGAPGFLASDGDAEGFFSAHGYEPCRRFSILQRRIGQQARLTDPRLAPYRQQFELRLSARPRDSWWHECVFCLIETPEFFLENKHTNEVVARARVWEMDAFSARWSAASVGILDLEVAEPVRRRGLARFLLTLLLRHLQDQFFELAEIQVDESNAAGVALCRSLGFELVDTGKVFLKK
jgi:ribosomal protein S18 acetylase RimI-like enzyme